MQLKLLLLGRFAAWLDGQPLTDFRTRKVQALLIYLAAEPQAHNRDQLLDLLWPGLPERSARANLRQIIYYLRQIIPEVIANRQEIYLNPQAAPEVDAAQFEALLHSSQAHHHIDLLLCPACRRDLEAAVALYRGDFLDDFYLDDSNEYEEWAHARREYFRRQALDTLATLAAMAMRQQDYPQAATLARRQLNIDNLREEAYRQLMEVLALDGRRQEALAVYETCRRILAEELGIAPAARTSDYYEKIRSDDLRFDAFSAPGVRGYELKEQIGEGAYGAIYRAVQPAIGREVAVKVIRRKYANDPEFIRRFEAEAQIVARLEHPYIVPLYDYWRDPEGAYLVMRYLRQGSLLAALQAGPWPPQRVTGLLEQIAGALSVAHQQAVVHRDIKPGNILLDEAGNAYLTDFGIARELARETPLTAEGAVVGTLDYISPEQILGEAVSPQTDIYSLGVVLYETLTGEKPFSGGVASLLHSHLHEPMPPVAASRPDVPVGIDSVLQKATAKKPAGRYASVLALAEVFDRAARGLDPETVAQPRPSQPALVDQEPRPRRLPVTPTPPAGREAEPEAGRELLEVLETGPELKEFIQAAAQSVVLYEHPPIMAGPEELFGREASLAQLAGALARKERVLLYGLGGSGKTALAARAAEQYLAQQGHPVIWLECGQMEASNTFDALARRLGTEEERQAIHLAAGDGDQQAVHAMLSHYPGYLLVLDNAWNGQALYELLPAIPESMPLLVTARTAFAFRLDTILAVEELAPEAALDLLSAHAGQELRENEKARQLCAALGFHAYSLELAGTLLKGGRRTLSQLARRAQRSLFFLELPGKKSVKALLDESIEALDEQTREVFEAAGALFAPGATPEFLATYLEKDVDTVWNALDRLDQHSLARNAIPAGPYAELATADFYRLHDLTFAYLQAHQQARGYDLWQLVRAVRAYLASYAGQFDHLHWDLPNILAAARLAQQGDDKEALVEIVSRLALEGYTDSRGYALEFLKLLDAAIAIVREQPDEVERLHYLLGKRGNAYIDRGEPEKALGAYREALALAPNVVREILLLAIVGRVCARLARYDEAGDYFRQARRRVAEANDPDLLRLVLEQESLASAYQDDHQKARQLALEGIEMSVKAGDRLREAHLRNNLGTAALLSAGDAQTALAQHQKVSQLAREEDDHFLQAVACLSLARDYDALDNREKAREHLERADLLFRRLGNIEREVEVRRFREQYGYGVERPAVPGADEGG
jgi:serine/threonine protein kinase/DNA-binding SARP family transcriptional activator/tetratricopeptide (TPR) repeat protein